MVLMCLLHLRLFLVFPAALWCALMFDLLSVAVIIRCSTRTGNVQCLNFVIARHGQFRGVLSMARQKLLTSPYSAIAAAGRRRFLLVADRAIKRFNVATSFFIVAYCRVKIYREQRSSDYILPFRLVGEDSPKCLKASFDSSST